MKVSKVESRELGITEGESCPMSIKPFVPKRYW